MKYVDSKIVFREVPDEVALALSISGCPGTCEGCHSPWLREDTGQELTKESLDSLISSNSGITCICFLGGDQDTEYMSSLFKHVKIRHGLKTAWYSGKDKHDSSVFKYLDYLKTGPYKKKYGPLGDPNTNQRFYKILHTKAPSTILMDITPKFWKRYKGYENSGT